MSDGTWIKVGCGERDDAVRKATMAGKGALSTYGTPTGAIEFRFSDSDLPLVRDIEVWGAGVGHCSHERFVPAKPDRASRQLVASHVWTKLGDSGVQVRHTEGHSLVIDVTEPITPAPWLHCTRSSGD